MFESIEVDRAPHLLDNLVGRLPSEIRVQLAAQLLQGTLEPLGVKPSPNAINPVILDELQAVAHAEP